MIKGQLLHFIYSFALNSYGYLNHLLSTFLPSQFTLTPLVLRLRASIRCNLSCSFCYQADSLNKKEQNHLGLEEWDKVLGKLPKRTAIDLTGGETFLAKNFKPLLEKILDRGHRTSLITNGSYPKEDILETAVNKSLFFFMVSVDGLENYHNQARGNPQSFSNILKTLDIINHFKKKYNSRYPQICLKTTLTDDNSDQLFPLIEFFSKNYYIQDFTLNLMFQNKVRGGNTTYQTLDHPDFSQGNTASYANGDIKKIVQDVENAFQYCQEKGLNIKVKPSIKLEELESYLQDPSNFGAKKCFKNTSMLTVYYDGEITPCDVSLRLSNIREHDYDLKKIWGIQTFKNFKSKINGNAHPACDGCCLQPHQIKLNS